MAQQQTYEGTPSQLAEHLRNMPDEQKYRMILVPEEAMGEGAESLEVALARMTHRTTEEIAATRESLLAATPPPRELPEGKNVLDVIMGQWPGNETDEQVFSALEKLS